MRADHPYRLYYVDGTQFWQIEDVRSQDPSGKTLIKDFGSVIDWGSQATATRQIYTAQEGNGSHDSDHWAWMAAYYAAGTFAVRAFVHYQVSTDSTDTLYPADLAEFARAPVGESARATFSGRPNMVEMTPDGTGVLIHSDRAYAGHFDSYIVALRTNANDSSNNGKSSMYTPRKQSALLARWASARLVAPRSEDDRFKTYLKIAVPFSSS
jgi:hypothetical protein